MGESRQELIQWLNALLQLNITKVEQCGTGAALCQVFDSIFLDLPMSKVKFNVNTEYAYLSNFKVLQNAFHRHGIDRPVPVESLTKCKMQDNLEFLQWSKRFWDQHFPGIDYDPVARRKGSGAPPPGGGGAVTASSLRTSRGGGAASNTGARRPAAAAAPRAAPRAGGPGAGGAQSAVLSQENAALKETVEGLERERDFYFKKLREIELLLQTEVEARPELENEPSGIVGKMQEILYSTEEGFEIPEGEGLEGDGEEVPVGGMDVEEETF